MYERIAYELRYEYLSLIEHGSTCMKHTTLSDYSYRVVCSHWEWITFSSVNSFERLQKINMQIC